MLPIKIKQYRYLLQVVCEESKKETSIFKWKGKQHDKKNKQQLN